MSEKTSETRRANRWLKLFSAELVTLLLLLFVSVVVFVYAVNMVFIKKTTSFDENIFNYIASPVCRSPTGIIIAMQNLLQNLPLHRWHNVPGGISC